MVTNAAPAPALLVSIPASNYVEKARWALQLAGIPFEEEKHVPVLAYRSTMPKGGRTVPLLKTGTLVLKDSADILEYCAQTMPSLYPNEEAKRLELLFDNHFGSHLRRVAWLFFPIIKFLIVKGNSVYEARVHNSWERLIKVAKEQEAKLGDGPVGSHFLAGPTFSAADITFCSHMALVIHPPELKYLSNYFSDEHIPADFRERIDALRQSKIGQFVYWCYKNRRPDVMTTMPRKTA
ncbi:TPA: hypothetical protein N0F65_006920 [Lagenidium giganteum]|uniref:GST N-terminal domain-containing protein n=1 Tax=Lagenidium giganteum TaxID=4803 RepID=A0AAV2ZBV9_9STRA|nr:TPA: hypothetical protein N0F65_006920 [Lagenidium giganteum]